MMNFTFEPDISRLVKFVLKELSGDSILIVIALLLVCRDRDL